MSLPNALVIGPQKAGTTWIHRYLELRGDICLPKGVKETMFFDRHYGRGETWYANHFHPDENTRRIVEVAPTYFHHPDAAARILDTLGSIPLICTLRDPAERSFSLYLHMRRYGMTACTDFREAAHRHPEIIDTSRYASHLKRWFEVFGRENILVLLQEDLAEKQHEYSSLLCQHLELPFVEPGEMLRERVNAAALPSSPALASAGQKIADTLRAAGLYPLINWAKQAGLKSLFFGRRGTDVPQLTTEERFWIVDRLHPEIEDLESLLERDLSHWRKC